MNTLSILTDARALIANPNLWWDGRPCYANKFCAVTAIYAVSCGVSIECGGAMEALTRVVGDSIPSWNDTHTHEQVLAGFDAAIAAERNTDISVFTDMLKVPVEETVG